jgi:hypothetical protein
MSQPSSTPHVSLASSTRRISGNPDSYVLFSLCSANYFRQPESTTAANIELVLPTPPTPPTLSFLCIGHEGSETARHGSHPGMSRASVALGGENILSLNIRTSKIEEPKILRKKSKNCMIPEPKTLEKKEILPCTGFW